MRKTWLRSLQGLALVSAVALLAGAKGQGCGDSGGNDGTGGGVTTGEPPILCGPGLHPDSVCDHKGDSCDPGGCHDACVPECPDGTEPVCDPNTPIALTNSDDPTCNDPVLCPPPGGDCKYVCQPADPCGKGFHEEEICEGGTGTATPVDSSSGTGSPGDPGGTGGGWSAPGGGPGGDPSCSFECVPDDVCPPGTFEQTVCSGGGSTGTGEGGGVVHPDGAPDDSCWTECIPVQNVCPPGTYEEKDCTSDGSGNEVCSVYCAPDSGGGTGGGGVIPL